jgi:two-component sensor histidine kinase
LAVPEGADLARRIDAAIRALRVRSPEALRLILEKYQVPVQMRYEVPDWVSIALTILVVILASSIVFVLVQDKALRASDAAKTTALDNLRSAKEELERLLGAKELLVHELSHRVMNNLQIILSLVGLVGDDDSAGGPLAELREKVYSIALIEEELHTRGALGEASLRSFLGELAGRLASTSLGFEPRFAFVPSLGGRVVGAQAAIPLALIISELAANAVRYGRGADGSVEVELRVSVLEDGSGAIVFKDKGPGFAPEFVPSRSPGLGYRLINALVSQLGGRLSARNDGGAEISIALPASIWAERDSPAA